MIIWKPFSVVTYSNKVKEGSAGQATAFFVKIRPSHKGDKGLLVHELTHVRQFYRLFVVHSLLYKLSKRYRYKSELEAYVNQIKTYKEEGQEVDILYFADRLSKMYDLPYSKEEIYDKLVSEISN